MTDIGWLYRFVATDTLDEEVCSGDHRWQVAKPKMAEKMDAFEPEEGKRVTFTEDGWKTYAYKFAMDRAHCYPFLHMSGAMPNIVFRKRGGPVLKLEIAPWTKGDMMTVELSLMLGGTSLLQMENVHPLSRVGDILEMCHDKSQEMKKHYNICDLRCIHVMSEWGEKTKPSTHCMLYGRDNSTRIALIRTMWCNCDRSKKVRHT